MQLVYITFWLSLPQTWNPIRVFLLSPLRPTRIKIESDLVPPRRIERRTYSLQVNYSANWAIRAKLLEANHDLHETIYGVQPIRYFQYVYITPPKYIRQAIIWITTRDHFLHRNPIQSQPKFPTICTYTLRGYTLIAVKNIPNSRIAVDIHSTYETCFSLILYMPIIKFWLLPSRPIVSSWEILVGKTCQMYNPSGILTIPINPPTARLMVSNSSHPC